MDLGGRDVTAHLMQLLRRQGYALHTSSEFEIVRQIKERFCLVEPFANAQQSGNSNLSMASNSANLGGMDPRAPGGGANQMGGFGMNAGGARPGQN